MPMSFLAAALLTLGVQIVFSGVVELTESARPGAIFDVVNVSACQLLVHLIFVFAVVWLYAREAPLRQVLGFRPLSPVVVVLVIAVGLAAEIPIAFVERIWASRFPLTETQEQDLARMLATDTLGAKIALSICFSVVWPLGEELFHRGAIFGRLRAGHRADRAVFAAAAFYALSTAASPRGLPSALVLGIGLTTLRAASGSTWATLLAHVAFMTSGVVREFRGPPDEALTLRQVTVAAAVAVFAMALLALRLPRDGAAASAREADVPSPA